MVIESMLCSLNEGLEDHFKEWEAMYLHIFGKTLVAALSVNEQPS